MIPSSRDGHPSQLGASPSPRQMASSCIKASTATGSASLWPAPYPALKASHLSLASTPSGSGLVGSADGSASTGSTAANTPGRTTAVRMSRTSRRSSRSSSCCCTARHALERSTVSMQTPRSTTGCVGALGVGVSETIQGSVKIPCSETMSNARVKSKPRDVKYGDGERGA